MANALTLARIVAVVPFVALFFVAADWGLKAALGVFVVAALTDFFDGRIARARGEVSALGAALDPLADKLIVAAGLVMLIRNGVVAGPHVVAALTIVLREILVSGLREAMAPRGMTLPVTRLAKFKTTAQLIVVGALLAAAPTGVLGAEWRALAIGCLWAATALTLWTGADYCMRAGAALRAADR